MCYSREHDRNTPTNTSVSLLKMLYDVFFIFSLKNRFYLEAHTVNDQYLEADDKLWSAKTVGIR